jgi:Protein of unknown function (DUF1549)/Protein of unknown function (DUF1553)
MTLRRSTTGWVIVSCQSLAFLAFASGTAAEPELGFIQNVVPVLTKAGCNAGACHGSLQGRGGFRLSLLGFDPAADYEAIFQGARGRRVSLASPESSLLLQKGMGAVPHGGGRRIEPDSESHRILYQYLSCGAPVPRDWKLQVASLSTNPRSATLQREARVAIESRARWSDGSEMPIVPWALYDSSDPFVAEVGGNGEIRALSPGKTTIMVRFAGQVAVVEVTVPYGPTPDLSQFKPANYLDELVAAEWKRVGVAPAATTGDNEFVRRIYLDLIGTLPQPEEVRKFLASTDLEKRNKLIDELLQRPEYVEYWALRWGDLLRGHKRYLGERGLGSFTSWVRKSLRDNKPLDEFTREVLAAQGNLYTTGPVAYYFVDSTPEELAETTAQVFLGVRMQCARCHHHPLEVWSQDDYYGLAAFFTRVEAKNSGDNGRFGGIKSIRALPTPVRERGLRPNVQPKVLGEIVGKVNPPEASAVGDSNADPDVRKRLAAWIVSPQNPFFARNFANRYWSYLVGHGIVEPVDDLRATNPPSNAALLDALAKDFADHKFDVKHLLRTICRSRVYQLAAERAPDRDRDGSLFTHRSLQRLSAEVLLDGVNQVCETSEQFAGLPEGTRSISLPDPTTASYFLATFGKPLRTTACECGRMAGPDLSQALHLANSTALQGKLGSDNGRIVRLIKEDKTDHEIADELYLAAFARLPSEAERKVIEETLREIPARQEAWEDVLWSLLNSSEFVFQH